MAKTCFCGCGRRIGLARRALNSNGRILTILLAGLRSMVIPQFHARAEHVADDEELFVIAAVRDYIAQLADEGAWFREDLICVLHDETSVREIDHRAIMAWIRVATTTNRRALART